MKYLFSKLKKMTILSKSIVKVYQRSIPKKASHLLKGLNHVYCDGLLTKGKDNFPDNFFCLSQSLDFISFHVKDKEQDILQVEAHTSNHIQRTQSQFTHQLLNILFFTLILQNWNNEKMKDFLTEILPKQKLLLSEQVLTWSGNFHQIIFYKEAITSLLSFLTIEDKNKQYIWPDTLDKSSVIKDFIDALFVPNIHVETFDEEEEDPEKWIISQDELWDKTILDLTFPNIFFVPSKKGVLLFVHPEGSEESTCIPLIYDSKLSWKESLTFQVTKDLSFIIKPSEQLPSMYNENYLHDGTFIPLGPVYKDLLFKITDNFGKSDLKLFKLEDLPIDEETITKIATAKSIKRDTFILNALPKEVSNLLVLAFATILNFLDPESVMKMNNILTQSLQHPSLLEPLKPYLKTEIDNLYEEYYTYLNQWHSYINGNEENHGILHKEIIVYNRDSMIKNILIGFRFKYPFRNALSDKQQSTLGVSDKTYFYQKKPFQSLFWLSFFSEDLGFVENLLSSAITFFDYSCLIIAVVILRFIGVRLILFLLGFLLHTQVRLLEYYFKVPQNEILPSLLCALVIPGGFKIAQQYFSYKQHRVTIVFAGGGVISTNNEVATKINNLFSIDSGRCSVRNIYENEKLYAHFQEPREVKKYFSSYTRGDYKEAGLIIESLSKHDFEKVLPLKFAGIREAFRANKRKDLPYSDVSASTFTEFHKYNVLEQEKMEALNLHVVYKIPASTRKNLGLGESSNSADILKLGLLHQQLTHIKKQDEFSLAVDVITSSEPNTVISIYNADSSIPLTDFIYHLGRGNFIEEQLQSQYGLSTFKGEASVPLPLVLLDVTEKRLKEGKCKDEIIKQFFREKYGKVLEKDFPAEVDRFVIGLRLSSTNTSLVAEITDMIYRQVLLQKRSSKLNPTEIEVKIVKNIVDDYLL